MNSQSNLLSMKRLTLLLNLLILFSALVTQAKDKADNNLSYEIVGAGTATQGYYLVEVSLRTKDKKVSDDALKRAAVHGVLFRGFSNPEARSSQKPLAGSPANEAEHADFYKTFFSDQGTAATYASIVPSSQTIKKVDKLYVTTAKVTVDKELLSKYLRQMGMIRDLNSAF